MLRNSVRLPDLRSEYQAKLMKIIDEWCTEHCAGLFVINLKIGRVMFEKEDDRFLFQTATPGKDYSDDKR
jgi:hypothetical protein